MNMETMYAFGILFAALGFFLTSLAMLAFGWGNLRILLSCTGLSLLVGYAFALILPEHAAITKTYTYSYVTHTDMSWIVCTPIVVGGALYGLSMWLRWRTEHISRELRELRELRSHGKQLALTANRTLPRGRHNG